MFPQTIDEIYQWTLNQGMNISKRTLYRYLDDIESFLSDGRHEVVAKLNKSNQKQWMVVDKEATIKDTGKRGLDGFLLLTTAGPDHLSKVLSLPYFEESLRTKIQQASPSGKISSQSALDFFIKTGFGESNYSEKQIRLFSRIHECIEQSMIAEVAFSKIFAQRMGIKLQKLFIPLAFVSHNGGFFVAVKPKGKGALLISPLE